MLAILIGNELGSTLDEQGAYFLGKVLMFALLSHFNLDRDPTNFRHVLNFLRDGAVDLPTCPEELQVCSKI